MRKIAYIRKLDGGKYRVYSEKGRNMGTYDSRKKAKERLGQIEYFKHQSDDGKTGKKYKMLRDLSDIAGYLEEAGFVDKADKVYAVMGAIDGVSEDHLNDPYVGSDAERNVENQGYMGGESPIGGGYSGLNVGEGMRADDVEQDNVDFAARNNGLRGITEIHDQNAGMFQGFNAEPQFSGGISYRNLEGPYG